MSYNSKAYLSDLSKDILEHGDIDRLGKTANVKVITLVLFSRGWTSIITSTTSDSSATSPSLIKS